jgi:YidC/Oxa1 family membrane protein insertase
MLILMLNAYLHAPKERARAPRPEATIAARQGSVDGTAGQLGGHPEREQAGSETESPTAQANQQTTPTEEASEAVGPAGEEAATAGQEVGPRPEPELPLRYVTLGSMDPAGPYRMLVTLSNQGAAVVRIELNDPRYRDAEIRSGYLGELVADPLARTGGCVVEIVGPGTPAAQAGIVPGDRIVSVEGRPVASWLQLKEVLSSTRPGQVVRVAIERGQERRELSVRLGRKPVEVIRPEGIDPPSFLLTLAALDQERLEDRRRQISLLRERAGQLRRRLAKQEMTPDELGEVTGHLQEMEGQLAQLRASRLPGGKSRFHFSSVPAARAVLEKLAAELEQFDLLKLELPGVGLREARWEVAENTTGKAVFRRRLPALALEIEKTYELAEVPEESRRVRSYPAYHLKLRIAIRNLSGEDRLVGYQLDGPTGLPVEGKWYAVKVGPGWGSYGLRDVAVAWHSGHWDLISCWRIADDKPPLWREEGGETLRYVGVDAQYFSVVLLPQKSDRSAEWYYLAQPIRVGPIQPEWKSLTNTSFRLVTKEFTLPAHGELVHEYIVFAGPKSPPLLAHYQLRQLVVYGWFWWVAIPMLWILHFLHDYVVFNYGLAIIVLTIMVRLAMFPLSKRQALAAQKMQQIQPELKLIYERYKNDPQQRLKAQQELFRKYNYNPLGGCLILLLQLPIFIGLYRALMVDVELRAAPLISSAIRWCSDLSAPDMLLDWSGFWAAIGWHWFNEGHGLFALGPYFNILPVITIVLFIWQQKMLSPPPADEQAAMQQKVMTFMLVFMGILFYKVASGLCLYFIASSLWGLAERQLLPKFVPQQSEKPPRKVEEEDQEPRESWLARVRNRLEALAEASGQKKKGSATGAAVPKKSPAKTVRKRPRK